MELKFTDLTKSYGSKTALNHVTFTLKTGFYGLLGANGAGKTTLMRLLCGLTPPDSGTILLDESPIARLGEDYRALLGYLPQDFCCYPDFTAEDFLLYMAALKGLENGPAAGRCAELLEAVGLSGERKHKVKTFSGGMKQRLGIAQALLNDPRILIMDEPTAGLDPKERVRFRNLISTFSREKIVLLSTHIVSDVESVAEDIIILKDGEILQSGKPDTITAKLEGNVWECMVPAGSADGYTAQFQVSSMKNLAEGRTLLRIISEQAPMKDARPASPGLEDLYLYYFKEGEQ